MVKRRLAFAASSIRRRSAAWTILLDWTYQSRRPASALCEGADQQDGPQRCPRHCTDDAGGTLPPRGRSCAMYRAGRSRSSGLTVQSSAGPGRSRPHDNSQGIKLTGEHTSSTAWWNDVPRGTMDEVSSYVRLNLPFVWQGRPKDCSTSSSNPMMEGPWCRVRREARARERRRNCSGGQSESA
jgi:hypothetical protein